MRCFLWAQLSRSYIYDYVIIFFPATVTGNDFCVYLFSTDQTQSADAVSEFDPLKDWGQPQHLPHPPSPTPPADDTQAKNDSKPTEKPKTPKVCKHCIYKLEKDGCIVTKYSVYLGYLQISKQVVPYNCSKSEVRLLRVVYPCTYLLSRLSLRN